MLRRCGSTGLLAWFPWLAWLAWLAAAPGGAASPLDPSLSAEAIYERVLENRFEAAVQDLQLVSGDAAGREQPLRLLMLWRRYPKGSPEQREGIHSRTLVRYLAPPDLRGSGYLVIDKAEPPDDEFLHLRSLRRTRRVSLRGETVIGTDLALEDVIPRAFEDAHYTRVEDGVVSGIPCYEIEVTPRERARSAYRRLRVSVEPAHFVPVRTRYFDGAGVEVKELRAETDSIREVRGIWLPLRATMRRLREGSWTSLRLVSIVPDAPLPKEFFTQRQLETRHLRLPDAFETRAIRFEDGVRP